MTGTYDPATNQTIWGTGNPVPMFDPTYRPGDNLFTNSAISWDPDTGKMNWYFQYTPGDMWDYDEVGTHILIDGDDRRPAAQADHPFGAQRLPLHHGARQRRRWSAPSPIWTSQLDQGHRPEDRQAASTTIPPRTSRPMRASAIQTRAQPLKKVCPSHAGGNNYWPSSYSPRTKLLYIPALTACVDVTHRPRRSTAKAARLERRR